jgi:hypothetical protein
MLAIIGCAIGRSENVRGIVPDPESRRAWGVQTHPLKITPLGQGLKGVKKLVKLYRASEKGVALVSEPRSVDEYPGIRVLRLWTPDAMPSRPSYLEPGGILGFSKAFWRLGCYFLFGLSKITRRTDS